MFCWAGCCIKAAALWEKHNIYCINDIKIAWLFTPRFKFIIGEFAEFTLTLSPASRTRNKWQHPCITYEAMDVRHS